MKKDLKIAIISNSFPPLSGGGGIASSHYNLYKMLLNLGFEVHVFTYRDNPVLLNDKNLNENNIYRYKMSNRTYKIDFYKKYFINKFEKLVLRHFTDSGLSYQFDLVRTSNYVSKKINKDLFLFHPDIVFLPDFGAPGYSIKKVPNARYFHISHHNPIRFLYNPLISNHSVEDAKKAIEYEQKSLDNIDKVICPSNYQKEVFEKTFQFDREIVVIPNIIDEKYIQGVPRADLHAQLKIDKEYPIVYIPSAASKIKGEQFIVEIIRRVSANLKNKVGFYLSGGMTENQRYELNTLNIFHVFAPGEVTNETNISYLKDCTICISPTLIENFGMALLEALFCLVPSITFDVGGNKDFIKNEENGYLVPYLDIEELIQKSVHVLNSMAAREKLIANIELTNMKFSSETIFEKYISLLK